LISEGLTRFQRHEDSDVLVGVTEPLISEGLTHRANSPALFACLGVTEPLISEGLTPANHEMIDSI